MSRAQDVVAFFGLVKICSAVLFNSDMAESCHIYHDSSKFGLNTTFSMFELMA